jgi:carbamoyltransferase
MIILGLNAYHGDASATLLRDGKLVAAVEEERFSRRKHAAGFPSLAVKECIRMAGISPDQIDHVAISRDPKANLHKKVLFALQKGPKITQLVRDRLANVAKVRSVEEVLAVALGVPALKARMHPVEHHRAHVSSAFFASGFEEAACLSVDGFGDFVSTMSAVGRGNRLSVLDKVEFPHSAGIFYTAMTQYCGFPKYGDEWKLMGLAPYGKPTHLPQMREIIRTFGEGKFDLNLDYFKHHSEGVEMTWDEGTPHLGTVYSTRLASALGPPRDPENDDYYGKWADVAASCQAAYEEVFFHILDALYRKTKLTRLCLAGGCALNSTANGKIFERTPFKEVFIQPAAGDNGTSLGAALHVAHAELDQPRGFVMEHAFTGPSFSDADVEAALEAARGGGWDPKASIRRLDDAALFDRVAQSVADGKVVGWYQGAMEFGPRALGNRSIVADPRRSDMKDILNSRIKRRETFRPFAPSVLEEKVSEYFERSEPSPFMLMIYKVREEKRAKVPAITHHDGSGRLQTVNAKTNPRYHRLISTFEKKSGVPMVLNTSFNEHEPIVCTPGEAIACFLKTQMDVLALGNYVVERA